MQKRTAIITLAELPEDTSPTTITTLDGEEVFESVYVELGAGYAELRTIDIHTAVNASTLPGPIEDHVAAFDVVG